MNISQNLLQRKMRNEKKAFRENLALALLLLFCAFLLWSKFVWFAYVEVSGSSMNYTLKSGDFLVVDRLAEVHRGDVIVFTTDKYNGYTTSYIKRVIALEGDEIKIEDGCVYRKNKGASEFVKLNEPYAVGETAAKNYPKEGEVLKISAGNAFVMGDNRAVSHDSRAFGEVSLSCVDGVVPEFVIEHKDFFNALYG